VLEAARRQQELLRAKGEVNGTRACGRPAGGRGRVERRAGREWHIRRREGSLRPDALRPAGEA